MFQNNQRFQAIEFLDQTVPGKARQGISINYGHEVLQVECAVSQVQSYPYTAISRKVVEKNVHPIIPSGSIGYDQFTVPDTVAGYFPLALANIYPWPLLPFSQISLKNSELKTTHNTIRDCRAHFFRQPFSKLL